MIDGKCDNTNDCDDSSAASSDEALLEMLGLSSLKEVAIVIEESIGNGRNQQSPLPTISNDRLQEIAATLHQQYVEESVCIFPPECSIPANHMRKLTEELVWGGPSIQADRTYENIQIVKKHGGTIEHRRTLTRLENFVDAHEGWSDLCHEYLRRLVSAALGTEMVLYKEKLNLKPPGGSGFAPHLDTPSLRVALGKNGPQTFCTVMVAIDDMTTDNGCLRICKGNWNEESHCCVIEPDVAGDPDAGGRAGAIPLDDVEDMKFDDLACKGGTVVCFNGWAPHRSAANTTPFHRRAVFLTYNPKEEGDYHKEYYANMQQLRDQWREKVGLAHRQQHVEDEKLEQAALATVPKL
jgi:ectoine hydroxylase-related dioxygenase (phytanoyl-CoA dioxygenase family)